jgi:hypothetical protein
MSIGEKDGSANCVQIGAIKLREKYGLERFKMQ